LGLSLGAVFFVSGCAVNTSQNSPPLPPGFVPGQVVKKSAVNSGSPPVAFQMHGFSATFYNDANWNFEASTDLINWRVLTNVTSNIGTNSSASNYFAFPYQSTAPAEFYRLEFTP
jgi:hypothetical protein